MEGSNMSKNKLTEPCPRCAGSGVIPSVEMGKVLQAEREALKIGRVQVAALMNISRAHLRELEVGSRNLSAARVDDYRKALKILNGGKK